jgi:hypothetical protein
MRATTCKSGGFRTRGYNQAMIQDHLLVRKDDLEITLILAWSPGMRSMVMPFYNGKAYPEDGKHFGSVGEAQESLKLTFDRVQFLKRVM